MAGFPLQDYRRVMPQFQMNGWEGERYATKIQSNTHPMKKASLALFTCSALLAGCASNSSTPDSDARQFHPEPGEATIYINRKAAAGNNAMLQTALDRHIRGPLAPGTYHVFSVTPGNHELVLSLAPGEHTSITPGRFASEAQLNLNAEAGRSYYFVVDLRIGWAKKPGVYLYQVGDDEGRKAVAASTRMNGLKN